MMLKSLMKKIEQHSTLDVTQEFKKSLAKSDEEREHFFLFLFASMILIERYDFLKVLL
jgi:hypothetical protein